MALADIQILNICYRSTLDVAPVRVVNRATAVLSPYVCIHGFIKEGKLATIEHWSHTGRHLIIKVLKNLHYNTRKHQNSCQVNQRHNTHGSVSKSPYGGQVAGSSPDYHTQNSQAVTIHQPVTIHDESQI